MPKFDDEEKKEQPNAEPEYELEGTEMKFDRVSELLTFYKMIPISFEVSSIGVEVKSDFAVSIKNPIKI